MGRHLRRTAIVIALIIGTLLLGTILIWLSNGAVAGECAVPASRITCEADRLFVLARGLNLITAIGIALSAVGTVVLIMTVALTERGTRAAVIAAEAATQAIDLARMSGIRELRPYLTSIGTWSMSIVDAADMRTLTGYYVDVRWQNVGQTPALNVRSRSSHLLIDGLLPAGFDYPTSAGSDIVGSTGRDQWFNAPTGNLTIEEANAVLREEKTLHVWSWVEYDGFEPDTRYRSEAHFRIRFWGATRADDPEMKAKIFLEDGFNGMDGTCHFAPQTLPAPLRT